MPPLWPLARSQPARSARRTSQCRQHLPRPRLQAALPSWATHGKILSPSVRVRVVAINACAAVAASHDTAYHVATGTSFNQQLAEQIALANNGGGVIVVSACPW